MQYWLLLTLCFEVWQDGIILGLPLLLSQVQVERQVCRRIRLRFNRHEKKKNVSTEIISNIINCVLIHE